jgi:hypothetical protein
MAGDQGQSVPILLASAQPDPYSLRLSFIFPDLPAPSNYARAGFKKFVERTVREESPAHLSVEVKWVDPTQMTVFKAAYDAWLEQRRAYWTAIDFSQENINEPR